MLRLLLAILDVEKQRHSPVGMHRRLVGGRVILRPMEVKDARAWLAARKASTGFLQPWEPLWPRDCFTPSYFMSQWRRLARRWIQDREYALLIFRKEDGAREGELLGGVTLTDIRRGAYQSGTLGYWMNAASSGRGYMKEAASIALSFAGKELKLRRVDASCMPQNAPSIALLARLGFTEIGMARQYMQIAGSWQDHLLFERLL